MCKIPGCDNKPRKPMQCDPLPGLVELIVTMLSIILGVEGLQDCEAQCFLSGMEREQERWNMQEIYEFG